MTDMIRFNGTLMEHYARNFFKNKGYKMFSPDWILHKDGELTFLEVKNKEKNSFGHSKFIDRRAGEEAFEGHGLDYYQYKNYKNMFEKYKIRTCFLCFDHDDNCWYYNYLDVLDKGLKKYVVNKEKHGKRKSQIIFSINEFIKGDFDDK